MNRTIPRTLQARVIPPWHSLTRITNADGFSFAHLAHSLSNSCLQSAIIGTRRDSLFLVPVSGFPRNHGLAIAENWLAKVPAPARPNQVWVSDITYLPTQEGWLYLAMTLDACSRKVVGWCTDDSLETFMVTEALKLARQRRGPAPGLLHHSDRGVQYASSACRALLANYKITASMSRKGNCYDNAMAESFFATLKTEAFEDGIPATKAQAKQQVFVYIEAFYNTRRFHSALGYQSPVDFENQFS